MPKTKRLPLVTTRLANADNQRLAEYCQKRGKTKADVAREALLAMLDHEQIKKTTEQESILERRLKKMEDRIASLLVRNAIDVGVIYHFLWQRSDKENRAKQFDSYYASAVSRLKKKLPKVESEVKEMMKAPEQT